MQINFFNQYNTTGKRILTVETMKEIANVTDYT